MAKITPNSSDGGASLARFEANAKALALLGILDSQTKKGFVKQASSGSKVIGLIRAMLDALEGEGISTKLSEADIAKGISQEAASKPLPEQKEHAVKIPSKAVKDSHYFIDISKDAVRKSGKSVVMVSFFMREGYLGRYMIKRNFFYLPSNGTEADSTYSELVRKAERIRGRYLEDQIQPQDLLPECKSFLDGIRGDFDFGEDSLGTTVKRDREGYHEAQGPPYIGMAGHRGPGAAG